MTQDFAHKPRFRRVKDNGKAPAWVIILVLLLVGGFGGFLFYLSRVPAEESAQIKKEVHQHLEKVAPDAKPKLEKKETVKPTNEFTFYDKLKEQKVKVETKEEQQQEVFAVTHTYTLQVASFRKQDQADSLRAELMMRGLTEARMERYDSGSNGVYYRVIFGPYESRSKANAIKDGLILNNYQPMMIKNKIK